MQLDTRPHMAMGHVLQNLRQEQSKVERNLVNLLSFELRSKM